MEATSVVRSVVLAANQYSRNQSDANLVHLQSRLDVLIGITSRDKSLSYFCPRQLLPSECLTCLVDLVNDPATPLDLSLKTMVLLFNLAADCDVRETLQVTFNLPASLASFLKVQRGSPNDTVIGQCVQLLQRVTYNYRIIYPNNYVEDLIQFLLTQILGPESDLVMPCLGLLANLCRQNVSVQAHIKAMDNLKSISKTLIRFLSHSNLTNIIFSLSILTSLCLNEELGDKLFNARNINQTFQLIFNILINGDGVVTRRYAVDLFIDLLKSPRIQQSLLLFEHFQLCMHRVLGLLPIQDEESVCKLFELMLTFCGVSGLRPTICRSIMTSPQVQRGQETHQSEAFFAVVEWASRPVQSNNTVSILALDLLREVYEEMLDSGLVTQFSPRTDVTIPMATRLVLPLQELEGPFIRHKLNKISRLMCLLMTLSRDEGTRSELGRVMTFDPCLAIVEHQLDNNQVGISKTTRMAVGDCDWSDAGVGTILHIVDVMVTLQSNVPQIKNTLVQILQDPRLVPFMAHGLSSRDRERVHVSLKLIRAASTLQDFPTIILGECIASNNSHILQTSQHDISSDHAVPHPHNLNQSHTNGYDMSVMGSNLEATRSKVTKADNAGLDKLIDRMQTGLDLKDVKASEIMDVYEHKLSALATKESHLQDLLEAKAMALAQADRLIAQYRCRKAQADNEARKLRSMIQESEKRSEEYRDELSGKMVEKERMAGEMKNMMAQIERLEAVAREHERLTTAHAELGQRLESLRETLEAEKQERASLLELHEMLTKHSEALKDKHETTIGRLEELEGQHKGTVKQLRLTEGRLGELQEELNETESTLRKTEREREELEAAIDKLRGELAKAEQAKKKLSQQVSKLETDCRQQKSTIREKDALISQQKEQLSQQQQLTLMIHSLTSKQQQEK
ncbi:protein CIP2A homolog isoform X2 [Strongylocentrotus purpuratus]|uniref:CIP2A N-terminal domain-containing protein n=1 Tax=Strongylocentrotus purpuratus TaxID=7668 RepID=A0A7M7P5Z4_STRPU|nr:protein CIP2A homolog isoform X1 [Strongylocentrotus purpuratus]XP_030844348.1 protein CIP2A homolog isoform X1 [Strongylocentrotus purpuratus]XP_030844349.1 protein CIP2A homolog isoform X1 [Strongylocentrotus purpuratus]XP_030844350.1 protein CIP2A homolog isoform X2 [Strongylocentrotus purpuratus]